MTPDNLVEAALQDGRVQRSPFVDSHRLVIDGNAGGKLVVKPNLFRAWGKRSLSAGWPGNERLGHSIGRLQLAATQSFVQLPPRFRDCVGAGHALPVNNARRETGKASPDGSKRTGSVLSPRKPKFSCQTKSSVANSRFFRRRNRAPRAIGTSMRANGAPKQKCAAQPKARCPLSPRLTSSTSGLGKRSGSRLPAARTATTDWPRRITLPPSKTS